MSIKQRIKQLEQKLVPKRKIKVVLLQFDGSPPEVLESSGKEWPGLEGPESESQQGSEEKQPGPVVIVRDPQAKLEQEVGRSCQHGDVILNPPPKEGGGPASGFDVRFETASTVRTV